MPPIYVPASIVKFSLKVMRPCSVVLLLGFALSLACFSCSNLFAQVKAPSIALPADETSNQRVVSPLTGENRDLTFEENLGQDGLSGRDAARAHFVAHGPHYVLRLSSKGASVQPSGTGSERNIAQLTFLGASEKANMVGQEPVHSRLSYFAGEDPRQWRSNVPSYRRIDYLNLYPGVNLSFYGHAGQLEYDFVVQPQADPKTIALAADALQDAHIGAAGDLTLTSDSGTITLRKPVAYQLAGDGKTRLPIDARYEIAQLDNGAASQRVIRFDLGNYDHQKLLVIDPVMIYGLDIPGASGYSYPPYYYADTAISAMTSDAAGNTYVAATVSSSYANTSIMKFSPTGQLLFNASLGSYTSSISPHAIGVDAAGNIYVAGSASAGLPVTSNAFQTSITGQGNNQAGFLSVIKSDGSALLYSSYLGTATQTSVYGLALDSAGMVYLTGATGGKDFPTTAGSYQPSISNTYCNNCGFVTKMNPALSGKASLVYSTYLAADSTSQDISQGMGIAVDISGNAYIVEQASSSFPVTKGAYNFEGLSLSGAYLAKLNPAGSALVYSAFLGPGSPSAVAVDGSGAAYVVGTVDSTNFPVTIGAYQTSYADGFAAKLNPSGAALLYSTYLSGPSGFTTNTVNPTSAAILPGCVSNCELFISGVTSATDFPLVNPLQSFAGSYLIYNFSGTQEETQVSSGFLTALLSNGKSVAFSTYLGGATSATIANMHMPSISADKAGNLYFASNVLGNDAPVTTSAITNPGEGYLAKIGTANGQRAVAIPAQVLFPRPQPVSSTASTGGAVELRNMGSSPVTIKRPFAFSTPEFSETDNCPVSLPGGGMCLVNVTFTPSATGLRTASLSIPSSAPGSPTVVTLGGHGVDAPSMAISATSLTFANQVVQSRSGAQTIQVTNSGNLAGSLPSVSVNLPDYQLTNGCPAQIAPHTSCLVSVVFSPTQIGSRPGLLNLHIPGVVFTSNGLTSNPYQVQLQGSGVLSSAGTGTITLSSSSLNFGSSVDGVAVPFQTANIVNSGNAPVTVNSLSFVITAGQGSAGDFSLVQPPNSYTGNPCGSTYTNNGYQSYSLPFVLQPQASCSLYIAFSPSAGGQETGQLLIGDTATGSPQKLTLSGIGLNAAQPLSINPETMTFVAQPVGSPSATQTFVVSNPGETFVTINRTFTSGDFEIVNGGSCGGTQLSPQASCSIGIVFNPAATGARTGTLTLTDALSSTPAVFNLAGTGIMASGALRLGQSSLDFGTQTKGTTSETIPLQVTNPGNSPVIINSVDATGDFAVTSTYNYNTPNCSGALAPGAVCQIGVTFSPTQGSGPETGSLVIHSSLNNINVPLTGTSLSSPQALHLTPASIPFGVMTVGSSDPSNDSVTVYVDNTGGGPITFATPPVITGVAPTPAADFQLLDSNCGQYIPLSAYGSPQPMPPGASCSFLLTFTPSTAALERAVLKIVDSAGTQSIALSGTGAANLPAATFRPAILSFDQLAVGAKSQQFDYSTSIDFRNTSPQAMRIATVAVTAGSSDFSLSTIYGYCAGLTLSPGQDCTIVVDFHPAAVGYRTGAVTFTDGVGKTYVVGLAAYSVAPINEASLSPESLIMPAEPIQSSPYQNPGASLYLNNTGNTPFTIGTVYGTNTSSTGEFPTIYYQGYAACNGQVVQPGQSCSVGVGFAPAAVGKRVGSLSFPVTYADKSTAKLTASLSGTGLALTPSASLLPQSLTFANVVVPAPQNTYSQNIQVVFTNTGTVQLTLGTITGQDLSIRSSSIGNTDFTFSDYCSHQTLNVGRTCSMTISFAPLTVGAKSGTVAFPVTYSGGKTATFTSTLTGQGIAASPALQITPSNLQFNVEVVGTVDLSNQQTVVLTATGNTDVKISSLTVSPNFSVTSNSCGKLIAQGSTCFLTIGFTPLAAAKPGPLTGTLTMVDNAAGSPHLIPLSGTAVSVAQQLSLSQSSVRFASQTTGTASAPQVVYLTDLGSSYLPGTNTPSRIQINSIKLGGVNAADFTETQTCGGSLGFTLQGRTACLISVAFAPGATSTGTRTASVTITPAQGTPLVIQLLGTGVAAQAAAQLSSTNLTFDARPVNSASANRTISITNTGKASLSIAEVLSTMPSEFRVVADGCSRQTLQPGNACSLSVSFNPAAPGQIAAQLRIKDNAPNPLQTLTLTGTGEKFAQAIAFSRGDSAVTGLPRVQLSGRATSGLPVTWSVVSGKATLSGNTLQPEGYGPIVVRADQPGDDSFSAARPVDHIYRFLPKPIHLSGIGGTSLR